MGNGTRKRIFDSDAIAALLPDRVCGAAFSVCQASFAVFILKYELARSQSLAQDTDHSRHAMRTIRYDKSFDPQALFCTMGKSEGPGLAACRT